MSSINQCNTPLDTIEFESFSNSQSWQRQLEALNSFRSVNTIAVNRTPKNVGNARL
jgi:hypothetical protein